MLMTLLLSCPQVGTPPPTTGASPPPARGWHERTAQVDALCEALVSAEVVHGLSVAFLSGDDVYLRGYGQLSRSDERAVTPDTKFEIASLTKVFTGILLADSHLRGEVSLDDDIQGLLPEGVSAPGAEGRGPIRLVHLSTHTSGLPRLPGNFEPRSPFNPYVDYQASHLWEWLPGAELASVPGERYAYSNLAAGLLGELLARAAHSDYDTLVRERIALPLGLGDTGVVRDLEGEQRLAPGHDQDGNRRSAWEFQVLVGAGGLHSTARDLARLIQVTWDPPPGRLGEALALAAERHTAGGRDVGLGWHRAAEGRHLNHNGQTGGYASGLFVDREPRHGVVVLAGASTRVVHELARALLDTVRGVQPRAVQYDTPVEVDRALLGEYVGTYRLASGDEVRIHLEPEGLYAHRRVRDLRLFPASDAEFFYRSAPARLSFTRGDDGAVTGFVLQEDDQDERAERIDQ